MNAWVSASMRAARGSDVDAVSVDAVFVFAVFVFAVFVDAFFADAFFVGAFFVGAFFVDAFFVDAAFFVAMGRSVRGRAGKTQVRPSRRSASANGLPAVATAEQPLDHLDERPGAGVVHPEAA